MDGTNNFHLFSYAMSPNFPEGGGRKKDRERKRGREQNISCDFKNNEQWT